MTHSENSSVGAKGLFTTPSARKLSVKEKIGYGLGDMASNFYFQIFIVFLPMFYTNVFGISAGAFGTMILVTRIIDAVTDPVMGIIADGTKSRWGKYRPYLIFFGLPLTIGGILAFTTPAFSDTWKLVYAYISYSLLMILYTAINVPYASLMGVITPDPEERTNVSQYRFVLAFIGQFIIGLSALGLVAYFGKGNDQQGWQMTVGLFGVIAVVLFAVTFFSTKERVHPPEGQTSDIIKDLKNLLSNRPWVLIGITTVFQLTFIVMRGSSTTYYFDYYVGEQSLNLFGKNLTLTPAVFTSTFLPISTLATLIGAILVKFFVDNLDKKFAYAGSLMTSAILCCGFYFLQPHNVIPIILLNAAISFFIGVVSVLQWAIYTDTADYGEWKFGRRNTALIMAASLFALKIGLALGGSIFGWMLSLHGFDSSSATTADTILGIRMLMSFYPAVIGILGALIMFFYPVSRRVLENIKNDLAARRK